MRICKELANVVVNVSVEVIMIPTQAEREGGTMAMCRGADVSTVLDGVKSEENVKDFMDGFVAVGRPNWVVCARDELV